MSKSNLTRRKFLQDSTIIAGGLIIPFSVPAGNRKTVLADGADGTKFITQNAYLHIGTDNTVKILLAHSEMGQGVWTTMPMLIAEELDCDWNNIKVEHGPAGAPYIHTAFGIQLTGGSTSTWSEFDRYRKAGATARMMLTQAAADKMNTTPDKCKTENGYVISASNKKLSYGEVAEAAAKLPPPSDVPLRDPSKWKYIGKSKRRLDTPEKINGTAKFGMDMQFPGMLTAVVAHPPVFGAKVKSFDASKAKAIPGVQQVVEIPSGVAVLADHYWEAKLGRDALKVEWDIDPAKAIDSRDQLDSYKRIASTTGVAAAKAGDVNAELSKGSKKIEAEYFFPYLAHAAMEPMNCTVLLSENSCEIWTGTQFQMQEQTAAAKVLGMKPEQVMVNTTFLGGAFGRRANKDNDYVVEAVHVAKASGKNVKLVWSREDDMRGGYYRPAFLHKVQVMPATDGKPGAWKHTIVGQSIMQGSPFEAMIQNGIDPASTEGISDSPYMKEIPNHLVELHSPVVNVPVLWWRSVGHTHTAFVMETMIDELAFAAKADPVEYRRSLLKNHGRNLAALNLAAEKSGWGKSLPAGHFRGVAVHESFGSSVAQVAEISIVNDALKVHKVTCAIDCGLAVNPDGVAAQMESGIIFGLTALLYGEITLEKGRVKQRNFHDYKMVRMNEAPVIDVHIVKSTEKMGGAGEPGTPPIAPAIANAIFAATGKRIRTLPLRPEDLKTT
ncbi:xanthine dehydrogenase family protein molybdopterin-binding subunit [Flavihumibacter solisilvae]|uniref:Twin-arginine translocation pathway signal protein n=1 Tax=Flavihumibacter solisilvae TaxID=1349421 RepID=A0A0C1ILB8_9BACT|nr:xanthine dehydrogenase family protein molybdopterin-binding subunit [Flavihumibacter solisilvae]KIC94985.1 twin-arginine translocation pathway signal protein [Flavihumibacter solisilvae]